MSRENGLGHVMIFGGSPAFFLPPLIKYVTGTKSQHYVVNSHTKCRTPTSSGVNVIGIRVCINIHIYIHSHIHTHPHPHPHTPASTYTYVDVTLLHHTSHSHPSRHSIAGHDGGWRVLRHARTRTHAHIHTHTHTFPIKEIIVAQCRRWDQRR